MGDIRNITPPSLDQTTSKVVSISSQIMIATVIVLFFVIAFCFFIHLYAKCYWSTDSEDRSIVSWRRQLAHQRRTTSSRLNRRGLDPTTLNSLPVAIYDPKDFKECLECPVCLSEVSEGEKVRLLPKCNHGFHVDCIDMWFQSHSTCPLCRNPVIPNNTSIDTTNNNSEVQDENEGYYSSDSSDFSDDYDDDHDHDHNGSDNNNPRVRELVVFPSNVLFWGNETQVSSFGQGGNASTSSTSVNRPRNQQEMVIEIPSSHEFCEDCLSSSQLEESKTPVMTRLASLKRLWSLGKRVASPSPPASSSRDVDQQV